MKNEKGGKQAPLKKEQLYSEEGFIRYCRYDYLNNQKLDCVTKEFLKAAEADGFLQPLLQIEEEV